MRWSVYVTTFTSHQFAQSVNLLTAGCGYLHLAVRAAERNAPASLVLDRLRAASSRLAEAGALLGATGGVARAADPLPRGGLRIPVQAWQDHLQARDAEPGHIAALLADAAVSAWRISDAIQQDAEMPLIVQRLEATLATLRDVLELSLLLALAAD